MQFKDATSNFGRLGLLLPLILIFLVAADSAYACPEHTGKVAYRTKAVKTRTASYMPTTVISYRAPASYRRCGANMYDTRGARYVAVRSNGHRSGAKYVATRGNGTRYVAVRGSSARYVAVLDDDDLHKPKLRRYGAVNDVDYGDGPRQFRTVAVRRPVYVESGTRYVSVRRVEPETRYIAVRRIEPRTRYIGVRHIDIDDDDEPRYVAVRRHVNYGPAVRYVTVNRDNRFYDRGRTKYVAVRNADSGCTRAIALRRCLDDVETTSVRRVVLRNDNVSTKHVVLRDGLDDDDVAYINDVYNDDDDYVAVADDDEYIAVANAPKYVEYRNVTYSNGNGRTYIAANDFDNTCVRNVAVSTYHPEALSSRTITYEVSDDEDLDDQAFLHEEGATFVAADDMEDARLSSRVVYSSPQVVAEQPVSYAPAAYVDDDDYFMRNTASTDTDRAVLAWPRYVALDEDERFDDLDPTWVAEVEDACMGRCTPDSVIAGLTNYAPVENVEEMDTQTVSYVPADDVEEMNVQTVSYVPVSELEELDTPTVSYIPVDDRDVVETVRYMPAHHRQVSSVRYVPVDDEADVRYIVADECPMFVSSVDAEPVYVADASTFFVEEVNDDLVTDLRGTQHIAGQFGYRDGFEDGQDAALEGDVYHPQNSGDFKKATEGYEDDYGDKDVYKDGYRQSYLDGYRAGFESGNSV